MPPQCERAAHLTPPPLRARSNPLMLLLHSAMADAAGQVKILPGEEFRAAMRACQKLPTLPLFALGDRHVQATLSRIWCALNTWSKLKFVGDLLSFMFTGITKAVYCQSANKNGIRTTALNLNLVFGSQPVDTFGKPGDIFGSLMKS